MNEQDSVERALVVRPSGDETPFNAADAVALVAEIHPRPIARSIRARLGRSAKQLLADGFDPNVVGAAMLAAVRMGRPGLVDSLAQEIQEARAGERLSFREWRAALDQLNDQSAELSAVRQTLRRRLP